MSLAERDFTLCPEATFLDGTTAYRTSTRIEFLPSAVVRCSSMREADLALFFATIVILAWCIYQYLQDPVFRIRRQMDVDAITRQVLEDIREQTWMEGVRQSENEATEMKCREAEQLGYKSGFKDGATQGESEATKRNEEAMQREREELRTLQEELLIANEQGYERGIKDTLKEMVLIPDFAVRKYVEKRCEDEEIAFTATKLLVGRALQEQMQHQLSRYLSEHIEDLSHWQDPIELCEGNNDIVYVHQKTTWQAIMGRLLDQAKGSQERLDDREAMNEKLNSLREEVGTLRKREEWNGVKHAIEKQKHIKTLLESETDELKRMRLNEQYLEAREKVEKRLEIYAKAWGAPLPEQRRYGIEAEE